MSFNDNVEKECPKCHSTIIGSLGKYACHVQTCQISDNSLKERSKKAADTRYGPIETHTKICEVCHEPFEWIGRRKSTVYDRIKYCGRSCAASIGGKAGAEKKWETGPKHYTRLCFEHHDKKCLVCGFISVVEAHHVDSKHDNDSPENLVPLCPNHHIMVRMKKYKEEIQKKIDDYLIEWIIKKV